MTIPTLNWIELLAACAGLMSVWFTIKRSIWCWPTGLVQVSLFIYVFYQAQLYSDVILHMVYVGLQIYGWISWSRIVRDAHHPIPVALSSRTALLGWVALALTSGLAWGWVMSTFTNAVAPFENALVMSGSLVAQWLLVQRRLESWFFWIAVDLLAIGIYFGQALYFTAVLYTVFLSMCIAGWKAWTAALTQQREASP